MLRPVTLTWLPAGPPCFILPPSALACMGDICESSGSLLRPAESASPLQEDPALWLSALKTQKSHLWGSLLRLFSASVREGLAFVCPQAFHTKPRLGGDRVLSLEALGGATFDPWVIYSLGGFARSLLTGLGWAGLGWAGLPEALRPGG